jgi:hypothetical protein
MDNIVNPQPFTAEMLKNVILCMGTDITREALLGARLRVTAPGVCQIASTDGHIAIRYEGLCLTSVRELFKTEYGVALKEVDGRDLRDYVIYPEHKRRKKIKKSIIEPDDEYVRLDSVIPNKQDCRSNINHFPAFNIDVLQTVKKITGRSTYFPDYWAGALQATVKELDECGSVLLVMPTNAGKDWVHYDAWRERNVSN